MDAELGSGKFGSAYEVVKGGKRYAAKITYFTKLTGADPEPETPKDNLGFIDGSLPNTGKFRKTMKEDWNPDDEDIGFEYYVRSRLEALRPQMPEEVSKHIVKHFEIEEIDLEPESGKSLVVYIMELLRPMTGTEKDLLFFGDSAIRSMDYIKKYQNVDHVMQIVANFIGGNIADELVKQPFEMYPNLAYDFFTAMKKAGERTLPELRRWIDFEQVKSADDLPIEVAKLLATDMIDILDMDYWKKVVTKYGYNAIFTSRLSIERWFVSVISDALQEELNGEAKFDVTHSDSVKSDGAREKVASFINAMKWLADNLKIYWHDLHPANIMMHPETNDYIATDVGMFTV